MSAKRCTICGEGEAIVSVVYVTSHHELCFECAWERGEA
jgi:hypothetical protein